MIRNGNSHNGKRNNGQQNNKINQPVRCGIYTRKSTEEGLDSDFNSRMPSGSQPRLISPARKARAGLPCPTAIMTAASPAETWNARRFIV